MKPKILASFVVATGSLLFASIASAQYGYGYGLYPAQQACAYPQGWASGASADADAIADLQNTRRDLQKDKRDAERDLKDLEAKKDKFSEAINDTLQSRWADAVIDHLENAYNCDCQQQQQPSFINVEPPSVPAPPPPPTIPAPPPRNGQTLSDIFEPGNADRAPASEGRAPAQVLNDPNGPPTAGASLQGGGGSSYDQGWNSNGFQNNSGGGQAVGSLCGPNPALNGSRAWQYVCRNGGGVSKEVCSMPFYIQSGGRDKRASCAEAVDKYGKVTRDADKARDKIKSLDDQIAAIGVQIGDLQKDARDDAKLEASCPSGTCGRAHSSSSDNSSLINQLIPLGTGLLTGLAAEGLGWYANKQNNKTLSAEGWPTMPDPVGSYGMPFVDAGIYGSVAAGQKSAFGCGSTMGGGMMPGMGMYPGMMGMGGMYPGMTGMGGMYPGMMGGGMFVPGMGMMGGMGMGMMMPGMGMMMPGMGMMMPGMGYSMPGMGMMMTGGMMMPGMGYSMPGMGMMMTGGMMMPGMGYSMPGMGMMMTGGMMMPGMGYSMPGMGMMMTGGMMMPGMGYSMPGMGMMMPGGMGYVTSGLGYAAGGMGLVMSMGYATGGGMMMPGYGTGLAMPYGMGMGGYGYGMAGGYGNAMMGMQTSQMAQLQAQQSVMSQYNALNYQMQQINAGSSLGGYGFGLGTGLNLGTLGTGAYGLTSGYVTPGLNR